ncbi:antibiotic biosynthesis monooxygenase [Pendulispora rubella]|uniref:Antibiotic biosynthesis monooxygenase n=1 Tax=Pendulispora rubella TaxID=2741070 RepID=A0ABZ2L538_9BACT
MSEPLCLPDFMRPDVGCVVTSVWYLGSYERQRAAADAAIEAWKQLPWPEECISNNCYLSPDGKLVWFYGQWTSEEAHRAFSRTQRSLVAEAVDRAVSNVQRMGVIRSRVQRNMSQRRDIFPGCIILVTIATDGPEHQLQVEQTIFSRIVREGAPAHPGGVGGHLLFSNDGKRVLVYAEWTSEAAHRDALQSGVLGGRGGIFEGMSGIEGIGFDRYHLYRRVERPR